MSEPVRVLVVDDDRMVRDALSLLLDGAPAIEVVGTAADGDEVPAAVATGQPDVVLMDLRMTRVDGITATERLVRAGGGAQVLVLTTFDADAEVLGALRAGAAGFLLKDTPPREIVGAIERVAAGEPVMSPSVTRRVMELVAGGAADRERARSSLAQLSEREREVVGAVGDGLTNAEIAEGLHMSVATVKAHVSHILTKLDLSNRTQIALLAHDAQVR
ncbi:MAG TPA: response regulator transcription factor [Acidimicrobiales bacterium]